MDCFYAQVELRDRPELKGQPLAVGGQPGKRGVLTTADYVARKFGVRSAMPSSQALRLCPHLVILPPDFKKYKAESSKIRKVFERYTSLIEPLSLDEAFLDVSESSLFKGSATLLAQQIRKEIFQEIGLTCSAGIAPNKFLAKVASDWNKPNGQFTISPDQISEFVKALPIEKIFGVGKVTAEKLHKMGVYTCQDLYPFEKIDLIRQFGKWGARLYELSRGEDSRRVSPSRTRKSFSVERTFEKDVTDTEEIGQLVEKIYLDFQTRWTRSEISETRILGIVAKVKFSDFSQTTHETRQSYFPQLSEIETLLNQAKNKFPDKPIRLLGMGVKLKSEKEDEHSKLQFQLF